jgi:hypothetical protein
MSRKICGWDIGIKNCSYCIINDYNNDKNENKQKQNKNKKDNSKESYITVNNNKYSIKGWDVINILPDVEKMQIKNGTISYDAIPQVKCTKILKKLVIGDDTDKDELSYCGRNAKFVSPDIPINHNTDDNLSEYNYVSYCSKHFKDVGPHNSQQYIFLDDKKKKCCFIEDGKDEKCGNSRVLWVHPYHYFLTYCDKHSKIINEELKADNVSCIKLIKTKNAAQLDLTFMGTALYNNFDKLPELCDVDTVLLENQPVLKNPTMKSIQMFLFSYFIMNGTRLNTSPCNNIKCYSANQKLDLHKILVNDIEYLNNNINIISKLKNVYSRNKKLAILLVEYILDHCGTNCQELLNFFKSHKKKDDLADSFLMTLHFLEANNLKKMKPSDEVKKLLKKSKITKNKDKHIKDNTNA